MGVGGGETTPINRPPVSYTLPARPLRCLHSTDAFTTRPLLCLQCKTQARLAPYLCRAHAPLTHHENQIVTKTKTQNTILSILHSFDTF